MNGYEVREKLDDYKAYVKRFSGAKIKCMKDYVQQTVSPNPDHIVIHVGTNDLSSKKESTEISTAIVGLALKLKSDTDTCQISVSNVTTRNDQYLNPLSANPTKLSNTLKQFDGISCLKG